MTPSTAGHKIAAEITTGLLPGRQFSDEKFRRSPVREKNIWPELPGCPISARLTQ
jgi:hypothetical protein